MPLSSSRGDASDELGRDGAAATLRPMIEDLLHLGGVPGHDDIGEETQGIGNCLHLLGLLGKSYRMLLHGKREDPL